MSENAGAIVRDFVLQGFDRTTDELLIELHVRPVPIETLRGLFEIDDDREMSNAYPVDRNRAQALQELVSEPIDLDRYDYFLQRYA